MNYRRRYGLTFLLSLMVMHAMAQQSLTLDDCRRLAIENNKALKMADAEVESSRAQKREAFTKYLPAVDLSGMYLRNEKGMSLLAEDAHLPVGTIGADGKFTFRPDQLLMGPDVNPVMVNGRPVPKDVALLPKSSMMLDAKEMGFLQVGVTQPVYMGGKVRAYNEMAGLAERLAESNRSRELQDVILATDEAYWQIVALSYRRKMVEKYVETMKKLEHDIRLMHEHGVVTKAEILQVAVKLNEAEMNLVKVEDGLILSRMVLNQLCGLELGEVVPLQEEVVEEEAKPVLSLSMKQVLQHRPEISSLQYAQDIYRKKERIALAEYLPNVALMANWLSTSPSSFDGISTKFEGMWSVGVGVRVPIVHWGASRKSLKHTRAQTEIVGLKLEEAKEKIELQVRQSEFRVKEVERKLAMARKNQEKAVENLKFAELGFREGTIPVLNLLEAQTAWLQAHSELIEARIEARLSEVYLLRAYGVLGVEN